MRLLAMVVACAGCTSAQARVVHRIADVAMPAGIIGVLVPTVTGALDSGDRTTLMTIGAAFVPVTILATIAWVVSEETIEKNARVRSTARADEAMALAKQAKHAARAGDCAEVQAIEPRVRELDDGIYLRFLNDPVIRPCRAPLPETE